MIDSVYFLTDSATKQLDELFKKIANGLAGNDECKSKDLPGDCTITADCLKVTCNANFGGKTTTLTGTINRYDRFTTVVVGGRKAATTTKFRCLSTKALWLRTITDNNSHHVSAA